MNYRFAYTSLFFFCTCLSFAQLRTGAEQLEKYLPLIQGKQIALVVNQTSVVKNIHLVDTLVSENIKIKHIFAPEHGFRGEADAGAYVPSSKDKKTGLNIISLYGKNKKPTGDQLKGIDLVVFDIQDVGVRFYTYISTMHYVMEACAENNIPLLILDRPNPNGMYVDGPVLDTNFRSFVGMHPIPILHGLTIGELAHMINGEKWLSNGLVCNMTVIPCLEYNHQTSYLLPIKPSPNLPNEQAIALYPSLCLFEATNVSVGRGTTFPFQVYGNPNWKADYTFKPISTDGASSPMYEGKICSGFDLRTVKSSGFTLSYLQTAYAHTADKSTFISSISFFNKLAGNNLLINQLKELTPEKDIRKSWEPALSEYKKMREKYLLYP